MSDEQKNVSAVPVPGQGMKVDMGGLLTILYSKLLGSQAMIDALVDLITTHDFSKSNPTKEQLNELIKQKVDEIARRSEEAATKSSNIIMAKPASSNLILPK